MRLKFLFLSLALGVLGIQLIALWASVTGDSYNNYEISKLVAAFPFLWITRLLTLNITLQFVLHYAICLGVLLGLCFFAHKIFTRIGRHRFIFTLVLLSTLFAGLLLSYMVSLYSVEPRVVSGLKNQVFPWPAKTKLPARITTSTAIDNSEIAVAFPAPYPHFVTFRPADRSTPSVNPPRLSWPYVPHVIPDKNVIAPQTFQLQISTAVQFDNPDIDIATDLNFYNALEPLEPGDWYWRIGYLSATDNPEWSPIRQFTISADTPRWDRSPLKQARKQLALRDHPRLGPPGGNWQSWARELRSDPVKEAILDELIKEGLRVTERSWWQSLPKTDRWLWTPYDEAAWASLGLDLAQACFVFKLTADPRLEPVKEHVLALSNFRIGGRSSPESHGGKTKLATQVTEALALCYDWLYDNLSEDERKQVLGSIEWRLNATYQLGYAYRVPGGIHISGIALWPQSHPFENFMWSLPAVLLTAGDSPLADSLVDLVLNYLTGVTFAFGPDEGFNEGYVYAFDKADSVLNSSLYVKLILPELALESNPVYQRFGEWLTAFPVGIERMSFAEYMAYPEKRYASLRKTLHKLALTTEQSSFLMAAENVPVTVGEHLQDDLQKPLPKYPYPRPWLDLLSADFSSRSTPPAYSNENSPVLKVFPDAGWVMASNQVDGAGNSNDEAVGMLFMARPRGGYSHSYRAENSFDWYAYGHTLSAGGGTTLYPDPHARNTMSHNAILVDGRGQEWNPRWPRRPYVGRILKFSENESFAYWVGDASNAYQNIPSLEGWQRHVVFVDKKWFIIYDDIYLNPDAEPAHFSWLFKVHQEVPVTIDRNFPMRLQYRVGDTRAQVLIPLSEADVEVTNLTGFDGFRNPITGADFYPDYVRVLDRFAGSGLPDERSLVHNNIWVTTRQPHHQWSFVSVLTATKGNRELPVVHFDSPHRITIGSDDGQTFSVSFDAAESADFVIDVDKVREYARRSR